MASEIIDIRHFQANAFTPLLQLESKAWGEELRWDYEPSMRVISQCLAEQRLSGYALVNDGRIEGYSFFVCEGEKGLVGDLFVVNDAARERTLHLLDHVLETLLAIPGVKRVEAQLPHYGTEELEPRFGEYGFRTYGRRFMACGLDRLQTRSGSEHTPTNFAQSDFAIEMWERRHDSLAAQLIAHTYRGHIDAVINDQYASAAGASRLIDNIFDLRGCGEPLPQACLVAHHVATGKLAGLVALTGVHRATAHVPQVAVGSDFQSLGLGTALLDRSFREAHRLGYQEVSLTVTDVNYRAQRFYERLGFETFRTFGAFVWEK
ncbi:MAG TPA: GNAT family N-acetyltransferase, partial [Terriglobia bacterium]|nr:GNAT family N-acetyltransferase [Terriglobia bacterium]